MAMPPARRQTSRLPDVFDWFDEMLPAMPFWRTPRGMHGIRIEESEEEGRYTLKAELPGIDPERDVEVSVSDGMLTLRAERSERTVEKHRSEFRYGSFSRTIQLPRGADESNISASYRDGILTITVPLGEAKLPSHKIAIARE
jgi:HSP20 family molecular chaperone IbpA